MIRVNGKRSGFTLIELLVVVGMIAVILGAITTSVSSAQGRARMQKAKADVKVITQAILAYEKIAENGLQDFESYDKTEASVTSLKYVLGHGGKSRSGEPIPVLLNLAAAPSGKIVDPWGHPYLITVKSKPANISFNAASQSLQTGYILPNLYRVAPGERNLWTN